LHIQGFRIRYDESFLVSDTLGFMYSSQDWPSFALLLKQLARRAKPSVLARARSALFGVYPNDVEGFPGVACSDSVNPRSSAAWTRAAALSRRKEGIFGPVWTWTSSVCAHWPGQDADRYLGPFNHYTAKPVLVVGNLWDPATPYQDAVKAARLLPHSRLLTVHGWGHTSLFLSKCADRAIGRYLLTTRTPAPGTVCNQDAVPFRKRAAQSPSFAPFMQRGTTSPGSPSRIPTWSS
jgi:hypothetical protein